MTDTGIGVILTVIGIVYGAVTGIAIVISLCSGYLLRHNCTTAPEGFEKSDYSSRGLQVYDKNMSDDFSPAVNGVRNKTGKEISEREHEANLKYFERNVI